MWGILETVQTAFHCAAIPKDTVLFLAVLLILSLPLFPSTQFIYLLLFFLSLLIAFVYLSPLCPWPLFSLCFLSLTAKRKESGSWYPKPHKVEMLNKNTDKAKKKKESGIQKAE